MSLAGIVTLVGVQGPVRLLDPDSASYTTLMSTVLGLAVSDLGK